jgi:hypothetical protein
MKDCGDSIKKCCGVVEAEQRECVGVHTNTLAGKPVTWLQRTNNWQL